MNDVPKIRAAYLTSKIDPTVFLDPPVHVPVPDKPATNKALDEFDGFSWKPKALVEDYRSDRSSLEKQTKFFTHICNHVAGTHGWKQRANLAPSAFLDVEMSFDQSELLNPHPRDIFMGAIMDQTVGTRAKKKIAKRRCDFIAGNVGSYSRLLNSEGQMIQITEYNELAASIAALSAEKADLAEASKLKKQTEMEDRAAKKSAATEAEKTKIEQLMPAMTEHINQGVAHVLTLTGPRLKEILRYYFNKREGVGSMKVAQLKETVQALMVVSEEAVVGGEGKGSS
jgi:hypothetical protein